MRNREVVMEIYIVPRRFVQFKVKPHHKRSNRNVNLGKG